MILITLYVASDGHSEFQAKKRKRAEKPISKKGEIWLDLSRYPKRLPRRIKGDGGCLAGYFLAGRAVDERPNATR